MREPLGPLVELDQGISRVVVDRVDPENTTESPIWPCSIISVMQSVARNDDGVRRHKAMRQHRPALAIQPFAVWAETPINRPHEYLAIRDARAAVHLSRQMPFPATGPFAHFLLRRRRQQFNGVAMITDLPAAADRSIDLNEICRDIPLGCSE